MKTLDYENQIFADAFQNDGLLITARGLGIQRVFTSFLKVYSDPGSLVLVLNTTTHEQEYFIEQLANDGVLPLPKIVTNELAATKRHSIYMEGGVLFVTSRILVVDMLTDRVPMDLVSGILVYKAHKILESCQEAFILRLYRQKNKQGFIKAFSESPQSFTAGFCHVARVMKNLFVRKLYLWPRFQIDVAKCLEKHKPEVIEIHLHMTSLMTACQIAILDLIKACVQEVQRCNPSLDTDEVTVEYVITRDFDKVIRLQLDPFWHVLSSKTKQLISDIKTLRLILIHLTQYDCVNFYNLVNSIRSNEKTFGNNSGWLFLDAADSLFLYARQRVFGTDNKTKKPKTDSAATKQDKGDATPAEPLLEACPKWEALSSILEEIVDENKAMEDTALGPGKVLVCAEDDRTCNQLKEYLCDGGDAMLRRLYNRSIGTKQGKLINENKAKGKARAKTFPEENLTLTQMLPQEKRKEEPEVPGRSADAYYDIVDSPVTILHPLHSTSDPNGLVRTLEDVQPRYVILYDADMVFVRQLEVFKASRPGVPLRVYFMMYVGSTEEQRYLTTLRKEKEAFEYLIKEKSGMVIAENADGKLETDPEENAESAEKSSRKGGKAKPTEPQKIIVDMREFRSELPSLIHRRGIEIEPVTVEVGDYILTPDICVERKSVSDLIGSLNNGRLYNQCIAMTRYYKKPVLLIEFDATKSFALQSKYALSSEISVQDITSKLTLLTLHFPKLRILWCQSPYATAELFEQLKRGRPQPDAVRAMEIATASDIDTGSYNHGPQDMLLKMPGVNSKNVRYILTKVESIEDLTNKSQDEIAEILGNKLNAKQLWEFLHTEHKPESNEVNQKLQVKSKTYKFKSTNKWKK
ncbi:unnamed protein product [Owenia fusiformis]|uniref:DNA repair endonuclease XPF n=1 Tax=Owenia fusiformis TaxID=6347 RepID=A0A8S4N4U6_OWEFU|nr:unnamed protein product [Owenia fusiformis]